jgi:hypothetical protein
MALNFGQGLFSPPGNFIAKGQWNDDKLQTQVLLNTRWSDGDEDSKTLYTIPAGKIFFLTSVLYWTENGWGGTMNLTINATLLKLSEPASIPGQFFFSPAIKLLSGETILGDPQGSLGLGDAWNVMILGFTEGRN